MAEIQSSDSVSYTHLIPGLIEGAGEGVGLGHQFLRHVDRCRLLVHIVDVAGSEGRDPKQDFEIINTELKKFNPELAERPMPVSYTHLDVYKRQVTGIGAERRNGTDGKACARGVCPLRAGHALEKPGDADRLDFPHRRASTGEYPIAKHSGKPDGDRGACQY